MRLGYDRLSSRVSLSTPPVEDARNAVRRRSVPVWASLLALALGGFGIGTTEFASMGVLPDIAGDLGVSIPTAGDWRPDRRPPGGPAPRWRGR